jgi:1-acyl-sn-glycerol-3-phosphate acyltransferase
MAERINFHWRTIATCACFAAFGLGGLLLGLLAVPALGLFVRDPARRSRLARSAISRIFRVLLALMRGLGVLTVDVRGQEKLQGAGHLILANHPTLLDVVLLMSLVDGADCIVKGELARNPFIRGPVKAAGFVFNDAGTDLVANCLVSLRAGNNLIIFPEGTRTPAAGPLRLQRGAARIALHGDLDITPVRISCVPGTLGKGEKWYRVPSRRAHFCIDVCDTIAVAPFMAAATPALAARRLTDYLTDYFSMEYQRATT